MPSNPAVTFTEDFYSFHWPDLGVEFLLERFHETSTDIRCEATVNLDHQLYGGRLYSGHLLLTGSNSRRDVRKELEVRTHDSVEPFDWGGMLEQVCNMARDRYRRGEPVVDLACVEYVDRPRFLLEPYVVEGGITIPYGDGKTAKSLFVLRNCVLLAQQGIRSLYLDWEDDAETHAERLHAVCNGMGIDVPADMIHYQRRTARLADSVRETRRAVAERGIGHAVVDSLGMAAGDPNDHGLMLEGVRAARALGVAVEAIHHLPKDQKDKSKPFGSVYSSNEARMTWLFEKAQDEGEDALSLLLTNHAFNRGKQQPKQAWKLRFTNDGDMLLSVEFERVDVSSVEAFKSKLPQWRQIFDVLSANGRLGPTDIATVLEAEGIHMSTKTISARLKEYENRFFVRLERGQWGVLERETTETTPRGAI